jgi:hypothetical protein
MAGIFCIEGFWFGDHQDKTSVKPILDLLNCVQKLPFVHHRCGTLAEFEYCIQRWKTKVFHKKYPVLWLAFHGAPGKICFGKEEVAISDLADMLMDKCQGAIIYFGSCATMKWDRRSLQSFMQKTNTLAVLGYKKDVGWLPSASFEIRLLSRFQKEPFTTDSINNVKKEINNLSSG